MMPLPNVSRKVRACTACQKQKVKCITEHGSQVCNRCRHSNLNCVFNRSLQTILDEDTRWKSDLHRGQARLERITDTILAKLNMPDISTYDEDGNARVANFGFPSNYGNRPDQAVSISGSGSGPESLPRQYQVTHLPNNIVSSQNYGVTPHSPSSLHPDEPLQNTSSGDDDVLVSEPMGSLYEVTKLNKFRRRAPQDERNSSRNDAMLDDFISRGVVDLKEAEELLAMFTQSLNHYLWVGLDERHSSINQIRRSSPLLAASILTAMSMHIPNRTSTYDACYAEFLSLVSQSMFRHSHNLDDIRGLTIAAFWLSDLSWKLSGHAIRIATELELHRSFTKATLSASHHERARIWYMLYVCDHHFANAYGRPPMMQETQQIIEHEKFLQSPFASSLDFRLLSQVSLFMILRRVYEDFDERSTVFPLEKATMMHNYNIELDRWRLLWEARQRPNQFIGNFPSKGIVLYYHFSKLQLNALPLHHIPLNNNNIQSIDPSIKEFINHATTAALSIINLVLEDESLRRALVGTPLYVHTMLTFACVFLFKLATKWKASGAPGLMLDFQSLCSLIARVIECLKGSQAGERHLIYRIAAGLEKMLQQREQTSVVNLGQNEGGMTKEMEAEQNSWDMAGNETGSGQGQNQMEGMNTETGWENMGFFDEFGGGFGMGINQFLSTQISFAYQS